MPDASEPPRTPTHSCAGIPNVTPTTKCVIKEFREQGQTQQEIADCIGVSQACVSKQLTQLTKNPNVYAKKHRSGHPPKLNECDTVARKNRCPHTFLRK